MALSLPGTVRSRYLPVLRSVVVFGENVTTAAPPIAVPAQHRVGLHQDQRGTLVAPRFGEQDPEEPIPGTEMRTLDSTLQHSQLVSDGDILQDDRPMTSACQRERSNEDEDRLQHAPILSCVTRERQQSRADAFLAKHSRNYSRRCGYADATRS
jgi:hypothetical protein